MFGKKKKAFGVQPTQTKQRTRDQVDREYTEHAIQLGHKARLLHQFEKNSENLEREIRAHRDQLVKLADEGQSLPQNPPAVTPKSEPSNAATEGTGA